MALLRHRDFLLLFAGQGISRLGDGLYTAVVAWLAWTLTHEEVFRELREFCEDRSENAKHLLVRKFFFLFTCEYCLSHWCALAFELLFRFRMVFDDWRGYLVAFACLVWTANMLVLNRIQATEWKVAKVRRGPS